MTASLLAGTTALLVIGGASWLWWKSDALITQAVRQSLEKAAPGWDLTFERVSYDLSGRVLLHNLTLYGETRETPILVIPEVHCDVNRDLLLNERQVEIRYVRLVQPRLNVIQRRDGSWNFQELPPLPDGEQRDLPRIELVQGELALVSENHLAIDVEESPGFLLKNIQCEINQRDEKLLAIQGGWGIDTNGQIAFTGTIDRVAKSWTFDAGCQSIVLDNRFVNLCMPFVPSAREQLAALDVNQHRDFGTGASSPIRTVEATEFGAPQSAVSLTAVEESPRLLPLNHPEPSQIPAPIDLGTELSFSSQLRWEGSLKEPMRVFDAHVDLHEGQLVHPRLPMDLYGLRGRLIADTSKIRFEQVRARNGQSELTIDGGLDWSVTDSDGVIKIKARNIVVTEKLRPYLPPGHQRAFDEVGLRGPVDVDAKVTMGADGKPDIFLNELKIKNCKAKLKAFPYPLTNVNGTVYQVADQPGPPLFKMGGTAMAGVHQIVMAGRVKDPGPAHECVFEVTARDFPIDQTLRAALKPEAKQIIDDYELAGKLTGKVVVYRPAGLDRKFSHSLDADLKEARMRWKEFPYALVDMSGHVLVANDKWTFTDFKAAHGATSLTGSGFVDLKRARTIDFVISAKNGEFDQSLKRAISTTSETMRTVWERLSPGGRFDAGIRIIKDRERDCVVEIPSLTTTNAQVKLSSFPYQWDNVRANVFWKNDKLTINRFAAKHGPTEIEFTGNAFADDAIWTVNLNNLKVLDLIPDVDFRAAAPQEIIDVVDGLALQDAVSLQGNAQVKGTMRAPYTLTAGWGMETVLSGADLWLGVEVKGVHGKVRTNGQLFPNGQVRMTGELELDSLEVYEQEITRIRGPFKVHGTQLTVGSQRSFQPVSTSAVAVKDLVTGKAYNGDISLDANATLTENPAYRVSLRLSRAQLEEWAKKNGYGRTNIRGSVNGWIDLKGRGDSADNVTGSGQLWISPAALYELPVFIRIFNSMRFTPQDKTAFRYAFANFNVRNQMFIFDQMELIGDSVSLVGDGDGLITFDERVDMRLVSVIPRSQSAIPFVDGLVNNPLVRQVTRGLFNVRIKGNFDKLDVDVRPGVPALTDALQAAIRPLMMGLQPPPPTFRTPEAEPGEGPGTSPTGRLNPLPQR